MTLRFAEGFDHYAPANGNRKWTAVNNASVTNITGVNTRHNSGQAIQCSSLASSYGKVLDAKGTWIIGFAMKIISFQDTSRVTFLQILDGNTAQLNFGINTNYTVLVRRGPSNGSGLANTLLPLPNNIWFYFEVKAVIHPSAGSVIIKVNGNIILNLTGVNTSNTGSSVANGFSIGDTILMGPGSQCFTNMQIDDLYVCDGSGTTNNDFLGDIRVETLYPSGAGTAAQWTPNGAGTNVGCVSGVVPDDDTTYVETLTPGNVDTYQLGDLSATPANVYGLQSALLARKTDAGSRFISEAYRIGGIVYTPAAGSGLPVYDSYYFDTDMQELSPATTGAWTASEVNNLEAGIKLIS